MAKVILIACSRKKLDHAAPARELYQGTRFKLTHALAKELEPDFCFVISAKHGLVPLDQVLEPYDVSLEMLTATEREAWAASIAHALSEEVPPGDIEIIVYADDTYADPLRPYLPGASFPLSGLDDEAQERKLRKGSLN